METELRITLEKMGKTYYKIKKSKARGRGEGGGEKKQQNTEETM